MQIDLSGKSAVVTGSTAGKGIFALQRGDGVHFGRAPQTLQSRIRAYPAFETDLLR